MQRIRPALDALEQEIGIEHALASRRLNSDGAELLFEYGVARSHSHPSASNDNPYSEAQFKTLTYCSAFPGRFGSIADARSFCAAFFDHYNHVHRHAGIGLHTPASVHYGTATEIRAARAEALTAA